MHDYDVVPNIRLIRNTGNIVVVKKWQGGVLSSLVHGLQDIRRLVQFIEANAEDSPKDKGEENLV